MDGDCVIVDLNSNNGKLKIPASNKIQVRTVLLSLMNSGIVSTREVASILEISDAHCRKLAENLANNDVADSLIDKRVGQLHDYRVGPMQKTEIIRQFAARSITGHSTASPDLFPKIKTEQNYFFLLYCPHGNTKSNKTNNIKPRGYQSNKKID